MSDISSYQGKALGTRLIRGHDSRRVPSRRYRRADGVESYYSSSPRMQTKNDNAATTGADGSEIAVNDGASTHSLGDLSQHGRTFKLPRFGITEKPQAHSLQHESEELAVLNPTLSGYSRQRDEFGSHESKDDEEETSTVILARDLGQRNDEKFLYQPEASNTVNAASSGGEDNMNGGKNSMSGVESVSASKQYESPWPRSRHRLDSHKSGYIRPSIAERISVHDEPVRPTNLNVVARLGLVSSVQPSSASLAEVETGRTSSPSILSKPVESSPFRPHILQEAASRRREQILRRKPPIHRGDLPTRPAPAAFPLVSISGHDKSRETDHITRAARDISMPAAAHVRSSTTHRELAFRRDAVAVHPGGDMINTNHLQGQLHPAAASFDGISSMHSYNTETPVEPSTLESIYEDASDEPTFTTAREEKLLENGDQTTTSSSFAASARKAVEYLSGSSPPLKPSEVSSDLQMSTATKPTMQHESETHDSRRQHTDKSQATSALGGVFAKVGSSENPAISKTKQRWPSSKRSLPAKSASSSIYSQPESHSLMPDIRAAFIRGEEDTHRYERLGYHHEDSKGTIEAKSSRKNMEEADQKKTSRLSRSPGATSSPESTNNKRPISQYTALLARRPSRIVGAMKQTRDGSTQTTRLRKTPSKSLKQEKFSRRFRPVHSNGSSKNTVSAEELLTFKEAISEEYETSSTSTDKHMSAISEKKTRGPRNWFEGVLSFHKKGTDQSESLFTTRRSDARLNKEVLMSGFIPYDKHASHSGSVPKRNTEDTERLIMMIENLEKHLDEALYPGHKSHYAADVPQQLITGRVEARTRRSPIRHSSRYIQRDDPEGDGGIEKSDIRSRFEKVSYGCDENGAMRSEPLHATSSLRSNDIDDIAHGMPGASPATSTAPVLTEVVRTLQSSEPERDIIGDPLSDNVPLNPPGDGTYSPEASGSVPMKPVEPDYYYPSGGRPRRRSPYRTTFAVNARKRPTVLSRSREQELSKERILKFIKEHNAPPIQPRRSSRAIRVPSHDSSQVSTSRHSERSLRVHTSMDGAHEADDEMESEIEYVTPRRKRKRANIRRHRVSYEEAHHMHFLHGDTENSGQIFEWPPHIIQARVQDDQGSVGSSDTQRVYVTARSRQNRGAGDLSPADERLVTVAAGFSVAFIMLLLCVYISFSPNSSYYL
ncbi:hypothetical protein V494_01691 [Pseudogymnoascus sp. VKM F-4513 (FW-928)]|nr:hypothetical protein V494_01691 [Pseudogymnoascus sp. VKM F-4513 (FW-928)]